MLLSDRQHNPEAYARKHSCICTCSLRLVLLRPASRSNLTHPKRTNSTRATHTNPFPTLQMQEATAPDPIPPAPLLRGRGRRGPTREHRGLDHEAQPLQLLRWVALRQQVLHLQLLQLQHRLLALQLEGRGGGGGGKGRLHAVAAVGLDIVAGLQPSQAECRWDCTRASTSSPRTGAAWR
jgi:hypothetical protein